ncbi:hypothetical protein D9_0127 [Aeromonas phage D9]|nr:hypothetical protein D9_0127 [Aeromonas phage D9]
MIIKRKHLGMKRKFKLVGLDDTTQRGDIFYRINEINNTHATKLDLNDLTHEEHERLMELRQEAIEQISEGPNWFNAYMVEHGGDKTSANVNRVYFRITF